MYLAYGDDYVRLDVNHDLEWYRKEVSKRFIIKLRGYLGQSAHHERKIRILNRMLTWRVADAAKDVGKMVTYEADQRHADLLMRGYHPEPGKNKNELIMMMKNYRNEAPLPYTG